MGCDIESYVEVKDDGNWRLEQEDIFEFRSYSMFAFLADVRNYSKVVPISKPRGIPDDISEFVKNECEYSGGDHSHSWLSAKELLEFNYSQTFEDRRNNGKTLPISKGEATTYADFLGEWFMEILDKLKPLTEAYEDVRIVFWFDN